MPCAAPVLVPERDLTRGEAVRLWLADRRALVECASRHQGLVGSAIRASNSLETNPESRF